jgi:hypothetical protein
MIFLFLFDSAGLIGFPKETDPRRVPERSQRTAKRMSQEQDWLVHDAHN